MLGRYKDIFEKSRGKEEFPKFSDSQFLNPSISCVRRRCAFSKSLLVPVGRLEGSEIDLGNKDFFGHLILFRVSIFEFRISSSLPRGG